MKIVCKNIVNPDTNKESPLLLKGGLYVGRAGEDFRLNTKGFIPAEGKTKEDYYYVDNIGYFPKVMFEPQMKHDISIVLKAGRGEIEIDTDEWHTACDAKERLNFLPKTEKQKFSMANDIAFSTALLDVVDGAPKWQTNPLQNIGDRIRLITELEKAGFIIKRLGE